MVYQTIEERTALSQQIQGLRSWDRIEIKTYQRDFNPLSPYFLQAVNTCTWLVYIVKADSEKITVSKKYDLLDSGFFTRRKRIKIGKIFRITPLTERLSTL